MHYTAGVGTAFSLAGARIVPGDGLLSTAARLLLDAAGALFGLYLALAVGLSLYGRLLRRRALAAGTGASPGRVPARLPGPTSAAPDDLAPSVPAPRPPGATGSLPAPRPPGATGSQPRSGPTTAGRRP